MGYYSVDSKYPNFESNLYKFNEINQPIKLVILQCQLDVFIDILNVASISCLALNKQIQIFLTRFYSFQCAETVISINFISSMFL